MCTNGYRLIYFLFLQPHDNKKLGEVVESSGTMDICERVCKFIIKGFQ